MTVINSLCIVFNVLCIFCTGVDLACNHCCVAVSRVCRDYVTHKIINKYRKVFRRDSRVQQTHTTDRETFS